MAVTSIRIWVDLQKKNGNGTWSYVKYHNSPAVYGVTRGNQKRVGQNFMKCATGTYRAVARTQILYGGVWYSSVNDYGNAITNPCS